MSNHPIIIDVDDLIHEEQIKEYLLPLYKNVPGFHVTAYSVPNRLGEVHKLSRKYPWITFAQHGFEHTVAECMTWSRDDTNYFLRLAEEMGYSPIFKAPNWITTPNIEEGCQKRGVLLHHHETDNPSVKGLLCFPGPSRLRRKISKYVPLHTHILKNPNTDFIAEHPGFRPENLRSFELFLTPKDRECQII